MIYDQKITGRAEQNNANTVKGTMSLGARLISFQADMEAAISDIINLHFRDPEAYDVEGAPFQIQIRIAKALIGPTPDDGVWNYRQSFQRASELVGAFVNRLHKRRNRN